VPTDLSSSFLVSAFVAAGRSGLYKVFSPIKHDRSKRGAAELSEHGSEAGTLLTREGIVRARFGGLFRWQRMWGSLHPGGSAYRPDIDGLRAISVIAVLLFHLSPRYAPAGAIGVDIFFVISGYLIGGLLLDRFARGTFSYADFYMRRIRRIMPALLVMNLVTLGAGLVFFYPNELIDLTLSGLCSLIGFANVYFYLHADYFADNGFAAFLHTWSLGVEEQFYILLPPLIALSMRLFAPARVLIGICAILIVSLVLSELGARAHSSGAFYLIHSRAWELAIGVLVAGWRLPRSLGPAASTIAAAIGLVLVGGSLVLLRPDQGFPGLHAVPPCLGAALLLASGVNRQTVVHRLLAFGPMRLTGLASYSIYLWHWPVIVFLHAYLLTALTAKGMVGASILSIALGFLSWRFVEIPFRRTSFSSVRVLAACGAMGALSVAISLAVLVTAGLPRRMPAHARMLVDVKQGAGFTVPQDHCFALSNEPISRYERDKCLAPDPRRPNWLLIGDSHAAMLYEGLVRSFPGVHLMAAVSYGCEVQVHAPDDGLACNGLWHMIFDDYLATASIDGIIITSRWGVIDGAGFKELSRRLAARHIKLLIIGPTPDFTVAVPRILAEAERRNDLGLPGRVMHPRVWDVETTLMDIARDGSIAYASPLAAMCRSRTDCIVEDGRGTPLYTDASHYTDEGAALMIRRMLARDGATGGPLAQTLAAPIPAARGDKGASQAP
jgi:peptidoglycan/LPS O-acetylase OafA/YrhL